MEFEKEVIMIIPCSGKRGCGERQEDGLYICVTRSAFGRPIEEFVLDPARQWLGEKAFRAPLFYEGQDGINHMLIWIGEQFYPFVPDYVEEARVMGVSRRIPKSWPIEKLTPHKSKMFLIHPNSISQFEYEVPLNEMCLKPNEKHLCTFDLWSLSSVESLDRHVVYQAEGFPTRIITPSVEYSVYNPIKVPEEKPYLAGVFAAFWITHLEYINKEGKVPANLLDRISKSNYEMIVLPN